MPVFENESVSNTSLKQQIDCNDNPVDLNSDNYLVTIESRQVAFFGAKLLLTRRTSSDATLAVGVLAGSLPQIFSYLQN